MSCIPEQGTIENFVSISIETKSNNKAIKKAKPKDFSLHKNGPSDGSEKSKKLKNKSDGLKKNTAMRAQSSLFKKV